MNGSDASLLILGHGSRDPLAVREFLDFTQAFKNQNGFLAQGTEMSTAFLELSLPSIPQALEGLSQKGARHILAIPYFLFRAGHVKTEIPEMIEMFLRSHPHISIGYGRSLWPHPNLITLAKQRIEKAIREFSTPSASNKTSVSAQDIDILVVGRGATDPEAIQQFQQAIDELRHAVPHRKFRHCFIALSEPKYADTLNEMLTTGSKNLILFPFYLFTGILVKRIESIAQEAKNHFQDARIHVVPHLGQDPLMFDMLRDRIRELRETVP